MFGIPGDAQQLLAHLQQVVGPVQELNGFFDQGPWHLHAVHQGQPLQLVVFTYRSQLSSLSIGLYLGGRPVTVEVHHRNTTLLGMPRVTVGDPAFDATYAVYGWPADVVQEVLGPPTRQWLTATYGAGDPNLRTEKGWLLVPRSLTEQHGLRTFPRVPPPEELHRWLVEAQQLTARTVAAFDRAYDARAAAQGRAAADVWASQHAALDSARASRQSSFRALILGGLVAGVALMLLVSVAGALLFSC